MTARERTCPLCDRLITKYRTMCVSCFNDLTPETRGLYVLGDRTRRRRMLAALANMRPEQRKAWDGEVV